MPTHSDLRRRCVVSPDSVQDSAMTLKRLLKPPFALKRALAALAEKVHENVHDLENHAVSRSFCDRVMKLGVFFHGQFAAINLCLLPRENVFEEGDLFAGRLDGSPACQRRLDHAPQLEELQQHFALVNQHRSNRIDQRLGGQIANHRALALTWFNKADQFERANSVAERAAADLKSFGEYALGGKHVARFKEAVDDHALNLLGDFLVNLRLADSGKLGFRQRRQIASPKGHWYKHRTIRGH